MHLLHLRDHGFPKGAQLTHRGSVHNLLDLAFMAAVSAAAAKKVGAAAGTPDLSDDEQSAGSTQSVFMAPTPLFHVTANNCLLHPATISGARIVFMHKWDAGEHSSD